MLNPRAVAAGAAREALSIAACITRYPFGLFDAALSTGRACGDPVHDTPVVLVHGLGHNRSGWFALDRRLRRAGFTSVHTHNYVPVATSVPRLAKGLAEKIAAVRELTGADRVHVVGHSLGGILLRWYVQELGGDATVDTAVTIASPHRGSVLARFAVGRLAADLRPGSAVLRRLERGATPSPVRWIAYWSNLDEFVQPASSAKLVEPGLRATNLFVRHHGHMTAMLSPLVTRSIVSQLEASEGSGCVVSPLVLAATADEEASGLLDGRPGEQQSLLAN